jgi:hypothetical protein
MSCESCISQRFFIFALISNGCLTLAALWLWIYKPDKVKEMVEWLRSLDR